MLNFLVFVDWRQAPNISLTCNFREVGFLWDFVFAFSGNVISSDETVWPQAT